LYSNSTRNQINVIGNAAPLVLKNGNIIVPFCRNNLEVFLTESPDNGDSWSVPRNISENVTKSSWHWIGTGPPASLQLSSGRIIVPSYHTTTPHGADGVLSKSYVIYSDDEGTSWQLGGTLNSIRFTNECQAVQLKNGTVMINSRASTTLPHRNQAMSTPNSDGIEFGEVTKSPDLIQPIGGCEGSFIRHTIADILFFSIPYNYSEERYNISLLQSQNDGSSWESTMVIDGGRSGYSALLQLQNQSVAILYERSNLTQFIFMPTQISFGIVWSPTTENSTQETITKI